MPGENSVLKRRVSAPPKCDLRQYVLASLAALLEIKKYSPDFLSFLNIIIHVHKRKKIFLCDRSVVFPWVRGACVLLGIILMYLDNMLRSAQLSYQSSVFLLPKGMSNLPCSHPDHDHVIRTCALVFCPVCIWIYSFWHWSYLLFCSFPPESNV